VPVFFFEYQPPNLESHISHFRCQDANKLALTSQKRAYVLLARKASRKKIPAPVIWCALASISRNEPQNPLHDLDLCALNQNESMCA
jgi:hypothetical protein